MNHRMDRLVVTLLVAVSMVLPVSALAAELSLRFPLGRAAVQTNETFDLAVVRAGAADLAGGELVLTLAAVDGTKSVFTFSVPAVKAVDGQARATEVLHMNGRLLRPGTYKVQASCDGASTEGAFDLFNHIRMSSFVMGDWSIRIADGVAFLKMGEESLGFNTVYGNFRKGQLANVEGTIRGGMDFAQIYTQSGSHQMDVRQECDWSDPYVLGGGAARGVQQAFVSRTAPNAFGVHLYDEPGLTWEKPGGPFTVSAQYRSYRSAFDHDPFPFADIKAGDQNVYDQWSHFQWWHLSFMDAAWKDAQFAVSHAQPHLMTLTQSVYGYSGYADGYYFNVVRSLPAISGHGGYSDGWGGFMFPALHAEYGRMRDLNKPFWYRPSWYNMDSDQYRLEQYLCFQQGVQGLFKPPDFPLHTPDACPNAQGIIEANKLQLRLGTIFAHQPPKRPTVAVLYSMSQNYYGEIADIQAGKIGEAAYFGGGHTRAASYLLYLATKLIQVPILPVVEEDILDGTLAQNHTVLILAGVNYLDPRVIATLEGWIASGGIVLISDECQVKINGGKPVGEPLPMDYPVKAGATWPKPEYYKAVSFESFAEALVPYRKALAATLADCGVKPVVETDQPMISASVQGSGDIEYIFLVNATNAAAAAFDAAPTDPKERAGLNYGILNATKSIDAQIYLPDDGRPVYDAIHGGEFAGANHGTEFAGLEKFDGQLTGRLRFGPGSMKVLARTARPIGGVQLLTPTLQADMTWATDPIRVNLGAVLVDDKKDILTGVVPMEIQLTDPLGVVRYNLFRASDAGVLKLTLPLAANDPAGTWQVTVRELLTGQAATKSFVYAPPAQCGAIATATRRAMFYGNDRENLFRFFRIHHNVTIVTGESEFNQAAAQRIAKIVEPWGVTCKIVAAKDHAGPRQIPEAAQKTWVGLMPLKPDFTKPDLRHVGFAIEGPVILVGNPEDHPMIKFGLENGFLAYKPEKDVLPGRGRGMIAWTSNMVGYFNQESAMVIAYDAAGMSEAVGTLYEACAAIDPLTATILPKTASVEAVKNLPATPPPFTVVWKTAMNDRVVALEVTYLDQVVAYGHDDGQALAKAGKIEAPSWLPRDHVEPDVYRQYHEGIANLARKSDITAEQAKRYDLPNFIPKKAVKVGDVTIVGYWGGLCVAYDAQGNPVAQTLFPNDITAMVSTTGMRFVVQTDDGANHVDGGGRFYVGLADGAVIAVQLPAQ